MNIDNRLNFATCSLDMNYAPEEVDRAIELLLSVKGPISAKHGCRVCTVEIEANAPGSIHYREEWDTEEALHRNIRSEEFRQVLVAMDLCREEPQIVIGKLSGHCGMEYLRTLRNSMATSKPANPRRKRERTAEDTGRGFPGDAAEPGKSSVQASVVETTLNKKGNHESN